MFLQVKSDPFTQPSIPKTNCLYDNGFKGVIKHRQGL
jgi:hypothetical protein